MGGWKVGEREGAGALGGRPWVVGLVGPQRGSCCGKRWPEDSRDFVSVTTETRQCVTLIDEATGGVTELVEESRAVEPEAYERLMRLVRRRLAGCRVAVMSGTIATGGPPDLYARCVRLAREAKALAVVGLAGHALAAALDAHPDVVKPNRAELAATVGDLPDEAASGPRCAKCAARGGPGGGHGGGQADAGVEAARGAGGSPAVHQGGQSDRIGDAFTAGLALRLAQGTTSQRPAAGAQRRARPTR
jgi:hypothetical protein